MKSNIVKQLLMAVIFLPSFSMATNPKPESLEGASSRGPNLLRVAAAGGGSVEGVHAALQEPGALASSAKKAPCYPTILTHDQLSAILIPRENEMNWAGPKRKLKVRIEALIEDKVVSLYSSPKTMSDTLLLSKLYSANEANMKIVGIFDKFILSGQGAHTMAQTQDTYAVAGYYFFTNARQFNPDGSVIQDNLATIAQDIEAERKKEFGKTQKYIPLMGSNQSPLYFVFASNAADLPEMPPLEEKRKSGASAAPAAASIPVQPNEPKASEYEKAKSSSEKGKKEKKQKDKKEKARKS